MKTVLLGLLIGFLIPIVISLLTYTIIGAFSFIYYLSNGNYVYALATFPSYLFIGLFISVTYRNSI